MKKREILLLSGAMVASLALGGLAMVSFRFGNQASLFGSRGDVKNYVLTLDSSNGALTGEYASSTTTAKTQNNNPITIAYENGMGKTGYFGQLKASSGLIYNSTAISGIVGITVNFELSGSGTNPTLTTGSSSSPSTNAVTITSGTRVAVGDFNFFRIKANNRAVYIESIVIDYVCDGKYGAPVTEAAPSSLSTTGQTTHYFVGDEFSYDGTATVTYTDSNHETCTPVVDTSNIDMNTAGVYTVGLSYTVNGGTVSTSYDITVDEIPSTTYRLVTSVDQLHAGSNYIISSVRSGEGYIASHSIKASYYLDRVAVTISDDKIVSLDSDPYPAFELSGSTGAWKFSYDGQYLYDGGTSKYNNLCYSDSGTAWSISVANTGVANILSEYGRYMEHYADKSEFTSYKTDTPQTLYLFTDYVPVELNLAKTATTLVAGHGEDIAVTAEEGATVTVSSLAPSIATASYTDGKVSISALNAGNATINVTATKEGASVTKTISVSVVEPSLTLSANSLRLVGNNKVDSSITATASNFYGDVEYSVSVPNAYSSLLSASISNAGVITFQTGTISSEQAIPVTVSASDGEANLQKELTVTVAPAEIKSVTVTGSSHVLIGEDIQLSANVVKEGDLATTVTWSSEDSGIATVSNSGLVHGVAEGTVRITATSTVDGSKSGFLDVTVSAGQINSVTVTGSKTSIKEEETLQLSATVSKTGVVSDAVTWSTSDADTATVSNTGLVTGVAAGSVTITATSVADPSKSGTYNIKVTRKTASSGVYTCNFESASGFSAGNDYQGTVNGTDTSAGATAINAGGIGWEIYSGTWSTNSAISDSQSAQIRYYTSSGNLGYLKNTTPIEGISNVSFKAKCGADMRVNYSYSLDGNNWTDAATNRSLSTSASTYNFDVPQASYFRISVASATTNKSALVIDDINITYSAEPTYPSSVSIDDTSVSIGGSKVLTPTFGGNPNTKIMNWSITGDSDISVDQNGRVSVAAGAQDGDTATVTVKAQSNAAGTAFVQDTATITAALVQPDRWTILVYMCGSSLEDGDTNGVGSYNVNDYGLATSDLEEIASTKASLPDDVNIVVEAGGAGKWKSTYSSVISADKKNRFHLDKSSGWTADAGKGEGKFTKTNMADGATFEDFLEWGLSEYPAEKTGLIVWNHGGAMGGCCNDNTPEVAMDDELLNSEAYSAFSEAFSNQGISGKLDWIGYDCCLMEVQDIAEKNSHFFSYQVASQELENGYGWDYDQWLPNLYNNATTPTILTSIVDSFITSMGGASKTGSDYDQTLSWLDLSAMSAYKTAWEAMALYLKNSVVASSNKTSWINLIKGCKGFGGDDYNDDYVDSCVFDVKDFLNKVKANATFYKGDMSTLVTNVESAYGNLVKYSVAQKGAGNANGLSMWYDVSHDSSMYSKYYAASETGFTNWRSLTTKYYGGE